MTTKVRLPWGAVVDAVYTPTGGRHRYAWVDDELGTMEFISPAVLEAVKPPSIDDPESWPLVITDHAGDQLCFAGDELNHAVITRRTGERFPGVILTATDMRRIARANWQRANELDAS